MSFYSYHFLVLRSIYLEILIKILLNGTISDHQEKIFIGNAKIWPIDSDFSHPSQFFENSDIILF